MSDEPSTTLTPTRRRGSSRGHYTVYTPEQKAEIGRYACEHGNFKAICAKFSDEFGIEVKESTVRQFKKAFLDQRKEGKEVTALRGKKRGRPLKISEQSGSDGGEYEHMVGEMAISTCITDLVNGETPAPTAPKKPLVLVAFCSDGKLERRALSSLADVRVYPEKNPTTTTTTTTSDFSLIPDDVCFSAAYAIVGTTCPVDRDFLDRCPRLKVVVVLGSCFDSVDVDHAGQSGIVVSNTPDLCIEEVADSAFSFVLSFYRRTPFLHAASLLRGRDTNGDLRCQEEQQEEEEEREDGVPLEARACRRIRGRTLGLLGLGKTGIALAQRAKAFGFRVVFYDPSTAEGLERAIGGLERVSQMDELLGQSDCVSLHCSLSEESKHIVNKETLRFFKRGSFLVNTMHHQLVDEVALARALRGGVLGGAALDGGISVSEGVFSGCPNFMHTPRVSWYSQESYGEMREAAVRLVHQALTCIDGLSMSNCVNAARLNIDLCRLRWSSVSS